MTFERGPMNLGSVSEENSEFLIPDKEIVTQYGAQEIEKQMFEIDNALTLAKKILIDPSSDQVRIVAQKIFDTANSLQSGNIGQPGLMTALRNFVLQLKEKGIE